MKKFLLMLLFSLSVNAQDALLDAQTRVLNLTVAKVQSILSGPNILTEFEISQLNRDLRNLKDIDGDLTKAVTLNSAIVDTVKLIVASHSSQFGTVQIQEPRLADGLQKRVHKCK